MWQALIEKYITNYILKYGGQFIMDLVRKFERYLKQRQALKELREKEQDANSSVAERAKAYEDAINTGRK